MLAASTAQATTYTPFKLYGAYVLTSPQNANSGTTKTSQTTTSFTPTSASYTTTLENNYNYIEVNSGTLVDSDSTAVIRANYNQAVNFSNKAVNSLYANTSECDMGLAGTGSINSCYGVHGDVIQNGGVGSTITNGFPVFSECRSTGNGTMSTCVGFYGDASYTAGTFTNYIGIKIPSYAAISSSSISALFGDNVGIATTSPGSLLSVGNTNGINFRTATSSFSTTGGINLASGCFAIAGSCISGGGGGGGSGTVTSVATDGTLTGGTITSTGTLGLNLASANSWTATATTSYAGSVGIGFTPTSSRDNIFSIKTGRTYTNSGTSQADAGAVNINCTNNARECLELYTTTAISAVSMIRVENTNTSNTAIMVKLKTASTQFAGNLLLSLQGKVAPSIELNEDVWNGGTVNAGGGLFQITSHDNNLTFDARNNANSGYCRQLDISPDFSTTTYGTMSFFPCISSSGSTQLGTGRYNFNGTSTIPNLANFNSTNTATQGDVMVIKEAGNVGIGSSTPAEKLSVNGKVYTTSGVQFGDGTLQTTAATGGSTSHPYTYATSTGMQATTGTFATSTLMVIPAGTLTASSTIIVTGSIGFTNPLGAGQFFIKDGNNNVLAEVDGTTVGATNATFTQFRLVIVGNNSLSSQVASLYGTQTNPQASNSCGGAACSYVINISSANTQSINWANALTLLAVIHGVGTSNTATVQALNVIVTP